MLKCAKFAVDDLNEIVGYAMQPISGDRNMAFGQLFKFSRSTCVSFFRRPYFEGLPL